MSSGSTPSKRLSLVNIHSPTGPKPLHLVDGTTSDFHSRNLASKSYKRSSYDSPRHTRSLDDSDSPLTGAKPRPKSVAYPSAPLSSIPRDRRSLGPGFSTAGLSLEDRPPLTSAEKHADLLRFIAQKESKCLELRSQLAVHEAELLQLKHKWERIVSRSFEYPHSFPTSSSPVSSTTHSPPTTFTSTSSISDSTPDGATDTVIEGLKEGVQGVNRLPATSLSITNGNHPHSLSTNSAGADTTTTATTTIIRSILRPTSTPLKSRERPHSLYFPSSHSHIRSSNLSTSSSSTTTTCGTRFSATPLSSASSFFFDEEGPVKHQEHGQGQEPTVANDGKDAELKSARQGDCDSDRGGSPYSSSSCSQELIVRDTGATPTVCPNPKFMFRLGRRKERERERERRKESEAEAGDADRFEVQLELGVSILGGIGIESRRDYADDKGSAASSSAIDAGSTRCHRRKSREASSPGVERPHSQDELLGALGPRSLSPNPSSGTGSQPNRAAMLVNGDPASFEGGPSVPVASRNESGSGTSQILPPLTSSWTSRGWGSTTLTKSQKRASLLFSDVSQTLASAFSSMAGTGPTARPPQPAAAAGSVSLTMRGPASAVAVSLLDQDEEDGGFFSTRAALQPMKPIVVGSTLGPGQNPNPNVNLTEDEDMDWGW